MWPHLSVAAALCALQAAVEVDLLPADVTCLSSSFFFFWLMGVTEMFISFWSSGSEWPWSWFIPHQVHLKENWGKLDAPGFNWECRPGNVTYCRQYLGYHTGFVDVTEPLSICRGVRELLGEVGYLLFNFNLNFSPTTLSKHYCAFLLNLTQLFLCLMMTKPWCFHNSNQVFMIGRRFSKPVVIRMRFERMILWVTWGAKQHAHGHLGWKICWQQLLFFILQMLLLFSHFKWECF